jgi:hypothetical protein
MLGDSTNSLLTTNGAANAYKRLPSRERHPDIKIERVSSAAGASLFFSFLSGIALHIWIYCCCEKFHAALFLTTAFRVSAYLETPLLTSAAVKPGWRPSLPHVATATLGAVLFGYHMG